MDGSTRHVVSASATDAEPCDLAAEPTRGASSPHDADRPNQKGTVGTLYGQGIRNAEGLATAPGTHDLWVTVNNRADWGTAYKLSPPPP